MRDGIRSQRLRGAIYRKLPQGHHDDAKGLAEWTFANLLAPV
jgi:hypothetical protein